jgi:hypothetical protein
MQTPTKRGDWIEASSTEATGSEEVIAEVKVYESVIARVRGD